ncbi:hypothetical protein RintRC_1817 [Richelia intracellularis]|nr:hypothetical protein RintRC_1817 [Richelia intracellularis]
MKHNQTKDIIKIFTLDQLFNPCVGDVPGVDNFGEEMQDPKAYLKMELAFPFGEALPRCWLDSHYRESLPKTTKEQNVITH